MRRITSVVENTGNNVAREGGHSPSTHKGHACGAEKKPSKMEDDE